LNIVPDTGSSVRMTPGRTILLTLIVAVLATADIAIVTLITGEIRNAAIKIVVSLWAVIGFALMALAGTWRTETVSRPRLEPFTIACAFLGIVTSLVTIWVSQSGLIARAYFAGWVIAFAAAHASLLMATRRPDDVRAVQSMMTVALVLMAVAASLVSFMLLAGTSSGAIVTITSIVLVLDVTATVLVFLLREFLTPAAKEIGFPRPADLAQS
jgi:hypothetical protein